MTRKPLLDLPVGRHQKKAVADPALDLDLVYLKVYQMRTLATKIPADLAALVAETAKKEKTTVSAFLRKAAENELAGRRATFGAKFGHLFGVAKNLPRDASQKEGYED